MSGLILIYVDTKENHMNLLFFFSKDWRDLGGLEPQKASRRAVRTGLPLYMDDRSINLCV